MTSSAAFLHCILQIKVVVRSSRSEIVGLENGVLRVRISSPPVDGKANKELIKVLARTFRLSTGKVELISGETSTNKRVRLTGVACEDVEAFLNAKS